MAKTTARSLVKQKAKTSRPRRGRRRTLAELNAWMTANHDALLKKARENCIRLTGKPTYGGTKKRKAA
jgi:ribosomal protein L32